MVKICHVATGSKPQPREGGVKRRPKVCHNALISKRAISPVGRPTATNKTSWQVMRRPAAVGSRVVCDSRPVALGRYCETTSKARLPEELSDLPMVLRSICLQIMSSKLGPIFAVESTPMSYLATAKLPPLLARNPDLVTRIMRLGISAPRGAARHHFDVVKALLLYAAGAMDASHNLVLPLSWPSATSLGGKPVRGSAAEEDATYVHAILHRQEGAFVGQEGGGLSGWDNAEFWFSQLEEHPIVPHLIKAARCGQAGRSGLKIDLRAHGNMWDHAAFLKTCRRAVISKDPELLDFCNKVASVEWNLLLRHSWRMAKVAGMRSSFLC